MAAFATFVALTANILLTAGSLVVVGLIGAVTSVVIVLAAVEAGTLGLLGLTGRASFGAITGQVIELTTGVAAFLLDTRRFLLSARGAITLEMSFLAAVVA